MVTSVILQLGQQWPAIMESGGGKRPSVFTRWQPGTLDAVRNFLLSGSFQSAVQLTAGVLFVSLFVFVE